MKRHALLALRETIGQGGKMEQKNVSLAIVGKDHPFTIYEDEQLAEILASLDDVPQAARAESPAAAPDDKMTE